MQQPSVWPSPGRTKMKSDSLGALVQVIKSGESVASRLAIAARSGTPPRNGSQQLWLVLASAQGLPIARGLWLRAVLDERWPSSLRPDSRWQSTVGAAGGRTVNSPASTLSRRSSLRRRKIWWRFWNPRRFLGVIT